MEDVLDELRAEIAKLRKLIFAARNNGVPEHDPELRGYILTLHAREELLERLEQPGGDARRSPDASLFIRQPVPTTGTVMDDSEAERLRQEIEALRSLLNGVVGRRSGDTVLTDACEEAIRERLERLKEHDHAAQPRADASPLGCVIRLYGIPVAEDDARNLVTTLLDDGSPYAVAAARTIHNGVNAGVEVVALTAGQRDAILAALEDPPSPGLGELRAALVWDALERRDGGSSSG